ncbi:MAG: restriction endonuclease subunit S [Ideonella sp.]|nr:restriction endonuclease subunit S [Ideonella sp.]
MNGVEQTAGAAVAEGDRRVGSGVGGVHAVAEPITATTRVVPLIEAVELNPRADRAVLSDDLVVSFVPMAAVEAGSGRMDANAVRRFGDVKKGYTTFGEGDVLFAKITPCMENGKMAVARGLRNGVGCGSTEFHVLRPRAGVDAHYVYHFVSSVGFRAEAAHHMTGAVGQKRVRAAFLEQCEIPLPDLDDQRRIVAEIEKQFSRLDEAVANLKRVKANLDRYLAATLGEAFSGKWAGTEADWRPVPLHELADVQLGQQRAPVHAADANPIPYVRAANVTWQGLDLNDVKSMGFPNAARYRLANGDLLLAEASGVPMRSGSPPSGEMRFRAPAIRRP